MTTTIQNRARQGAIPSHKMNSPQPVERFLNTAQAAHEIGMSKSWLEKGRVYFYGPPFVSLRRPGSKVGAIRYRLSALQQWVEDQQRNPEADCDV